MEDIKSEARLKSEEFNITEQTLVNGITHTRAPESLYLESRYEFGEKLGQGAFGYVQIVMAKHNYESFAMKSVKKMTGSANAYEQVQREIAIMKLVSHPHIVKLVEVLETPKKVYLILELCAGGELVRQIRMHQSCSEDECRLIIERLADAVAYLHTQGIVHRDIKPENILLSTENTSDQWNIKLSDFGLCTFTNACSMMDNMCGTPLYMAPEIVQNLGYSAQCDVWSIGVLMYLLLCAYKKEAETNLKYMIQSGEITYPEIFWSEISPGAKHLVDLMLRIDPAKRITAKEILWHSWITGIESPQGIVPNTNVLDLMKSYNAERRLRKCMLAVRVSIRWMKLGKDAGLMRKLEDIEILDSTASSQILKVTGGSVNALSENIRSHKETSSQILHPQILRPISQQNLESAIQPAIRRPSALNLNKTSYNKLHDKGASSKSHLITSPIKSSYLKSQTITPLSPTLAVPVTMKVTAGRRRSSSELPSIIPPQQDKFERKELNAVTSRKLFK